jgi:hypothetical protein
MSDYINLIVGDDSGDGHSMTKTVTISTDRSSQEIEKLFELVSKKYSLDNLCSEYEDNLVTNEHFERVYVNLGKDKAIELYGSPSDEDWDNPDNYGIYNQIDHCQFIDIVIGLMNAEDPKANIKLADIPTIAIGGYGLFFL